MSFGFTGSIQPYYSTIDLLQYSNTTNDYTNVSFNSEYICILNNSYITIYSIDTYIINSRLTYSDLKISKNDIKNIFLTRIDNNISGLFIVISNTLNVFISIVLQNIIIFVLSLTR